MSAPTFFYFMLSSCNEGLLPAKLYLVTLFNLEFEKFHLQHVLIINNLKIKLIGYNAMVSRVNHNTL